MAVLVIAASAVVLKDRALEEWYILKLDGDGHDRALAAEKLGDMKSVRAIPKLIEYFRRETGGPLPVQFCTFALVRIGAPAVPALIPELKSKKTWVPADAAMVLEGIGPPAKDAIPALEDLSMSHDSRNEEAAKRALRAIRNSPGEGGKGVR